MPSIVSRKPHGCTQPVYYYHRTYRVKLNPDCSGKGPGSGPSKVKSEDVYLGTAEDILARFRSSVSANVEVSHKAFGMPLAVLQVVNELGIRNIINTHIPKRRQGMTPGDYICLGIIAKLCAPAVSWNGFRGWVSRTVLPGKLGLDPELLDSQNFWDHFDKILPENGVHKPKPGGGICDDVIMDIEEDLWRRISHLYNIPLDCLLYDTTNYYTFFEPTTRSELAAPGKNKAGRHELRQVGLALAVTKDGGFPMLHTFFAGNLHDARLFPGNLTKMVHRLCALGRGCEKVILVMDKGNNSQENFEMASRTGMYIVGSLVPAHNKDLMSVPLDRFSLKLGELVAYEGRKELWGIPAKVVVTYNQSLAERQKIGFEKALDRLTSELGLSFEKHKDESKAEIEKALEGVRRGSRVGGYVRYIVAGRRYKSLKVEVDAKKKARKEATFGKRILFSTDTSMNPETVVEIYNRDKSEIEDAFKMSKAPDIIRLQPIRHWTDSKIRVYGLICVLAMLVVKVMMRKLKESGMEMSPQVLKQELDDIREIAILHATNEVETKVSAMSTVQKKLFDLFGLGRYTK